MSSESKKLHSELTSDSVPSAHEVGSPDTRVQLVDDVYLLKSQVAALQSEADRLNTEIASRKTVLDSQLRLQTAELKKLEAQVILKKAEIELELESIGSSKTEAEAEWERLKTQIAGGSAELDQLQRNLNHERQRTRELEIRLAELEKNCRAAESSQRAAELAREVAEREKYLAFDETRKATSETNRLRDETAAAAAEIASMGERRSNLLVIVGELDKAREIALSNLGDLNKRLDEARLTFAAVGAELDAARNEVGVLRGEASSIIGLARAESDRITKESVGRAEAEALAAKTRIELEVDAYVSATKMEAETAARMILESANSESATLRQSAKDYDHKTRSEAEEFSNKLRGEAQEYATGMQQEADERAQKIEQDANIEADDRRRELDEQVAAKLADLERHLSSIREEAQSEVDAKKAQAQADYDILMEKVHNSMADLRAQTVREAEVEAERIQEQIEAMERSAHQEAEKVISRAMQEELAIVSAAEKHAKDLQALGDQEYQERKLVEDKQLVENRYRAQAELEAWMADEKKSFVAKRRQNQREIIRVVESLVKERVKPVVAKKNSRSSIRDLAADVREILENALEREELGQGGELGLDRFANLGHKGKSQSKQYWQNLLWRVVVPIAVLATLLAFPVVRRGISSLFAPKAGKSMQQSYVEAQNKKAQLEREYHPEQSPEVKDTYVDNVLFTTNFVETVLAKVYQQKWTMALSKFVVKDLDLRDDVLVRLQPRETLLIKDLERTKKEINAKYLNESLDRMRASEEEAIDKMTQLLGTSANYVKFVEFRKKFYEEFVAKAHSKVAEPKVVDPDPNP